MNWRLLLLPVLCSLLGSCLRLPVIEARTLQFQAGPMGRPMDNASLLKEGVVPAELLVSIPEAVGRAPEGSLLIACWRTTVITNFWGPCSHVARKLGVGLMADQPGVSAVAGVRSTAVLSKRYAVIVLDVGVRRAQYPALEARVEQLKGQMYSFSGAPGSSYCSDYQNDLQRALKLPDVMQLNAAWNGLLPADALKMPGARVLWVGVNEAASR